VLLLQGFESAQLLVPIGLQGIGDETMIRIALQKAPTLEFRFVARPFQLLLTQSIGLLDAPADLVLDSEGDLDRSGRDGTQQHFPDRGVYVTSENRLTRFSGATHDVLCADVVRQKPISEPRVLLITRAHPAAASAADHVALQEPRALARQCASAAAAAVCGEILFEHHLIALELLPGNVADVGITDQHHPARATRTWVLDFKSALCGHAYGLLLRTLHLCETLTLEDFRRETLRALNHNERTHTLQRQIRRDGARSRRGRRTEELVAQSGALALVTNLVMAWNTHQMQATLDRWRAQGRQIDPQVLHHITPMGFEGINFGGILVSPLERYRSRLLPSSSPPPTTMVA